MRQFDKGKGGREEGEGGYHRRKEEKPPFFNSYKGLGQQKQREGKRRKAFSFIVTRG